jgi:aspartyl-tRNA(Asn)/glutamyl-tRNA(Gln) amidotransferase subunit A
MDTARALLAAYKARNLSPVEVVAQALAAIAADNPRVNAWVHVAAETALRDAAASEARWKIGAPLGALDGVPVGVKDLLAVKNQPMRRGSEAFPPDFTPSEDSPVVARLREAGAILLGKTATPDAGCKLDTTSLVHGVTRNPFNPALTAGGSSGGSAAALALGHVPVAIGTDGAGSIRVPASYCGVFGMKPSIGRIPAPVGPFWPHAVTGPMTRTVLDTALVWNVVTRPDARDPYGLPYVETDWVAQARRGVSGLRVAVATSFHGMAAAPEIAEAVMRAAAALSQAGAVVTAREPDWPGDPLAAFAVFWRCMYAQSVAMMPAAQAAMIDPAIRQVVAGAAGISCVDLQNAMAARDALAGAMARFHQDDDLLVCPVMPYQPWPAGRATPAPFAEDDWSWCPFAYPFNMTRQPAASVPVGKDGDGMPIGVQIVAAYGRDDLVMRAAFSVEQSMSTTLGFDVS